MRSLRPYLILVLLNLLSVVATYAILFVPLGGQPAPGLSVVHRYWDGPPYVMVAHSLYDPTDPIWDEYGRKFGIRDLDADTHATVLILYPLAIRSLAPIFGYFNAMIVATFIFSSLCAAVLYRVLAEFRMVREPLWSSIIFLFFPPRWVIYHSVGASEPPFLLFILCAFYFYRKRSLFLTGVFGGLATITRIFGVLLLPAFLLAELHRYGRACGWEPARFFSRGLLGVFGKTIPALLPIPVFLLLNFGLYQLRLGDFWAYFRQNGQFLISVPLKGVYDAAFVEPTAGYGTVLLFMAVVYGLVWQWRQDHKDVFFVAICLAAPMPFTLLSDLGRFLLPVCPFLLLAPFDEMWTRVEAKWAFFLCLPVTYAYVWACLQQNTMALPIYDSLRQFLAATGG